FGLSPLSLAKAKSYQRVEIIKGSASRQSTFAQDDGWNDAVNQKLNLARDAINLSGGTPVVFSDCDTIVVHDFSENLHLKCDVGLCRRRAPKFYTYGGEVPERSDFITSFILFNDPIKSKRFIAKIQNKMQELRDSGAPSPWETRACNHIIYKDEIEDINICSFREIIISAENCYVPGTTKIIHYKTNPMAGGRGFQRLMPSMVFAHAIIMKNMPFWLGRRFIKFLKTGQE
ncbi:MAG: hypothetical protein FWC83_02080, partial [Alphaproteobacteria bacterium]|nr:hypothetical protein [Alphaproteobacteria bacterium]